MSEKRKRQEPEEEEFEVKRPIKPIPASKLQAFTIGVQKKTAFQRHKEEADLKKQQDDLEAAKVYAEFVASFEEPKPYQLGTTSFVKSGTLLPRDPSTDSYHAPTTPSSKPAFKPMPFVRAGETRPPKPAMPAHTSYKAKTAAAHNTAQDSDEEDDALARMRTKAQKKRNLDSFLEEIKKGQEIRTRVDAKITSQDHGGSFDDGNPNSTNLYVGNINPTVTEAGLCQEFGKYGPIASVKIMWPRTQEEKDKGNNCGFVSFMTRQDAANAIRSLDGKDLNGYALRVGWGKAVPIPAQPCFVLDKKAPTTKSGLPFNAQVSAGASGVNSRPRAEIHVVKPTDINLMRTIHRMIERVLVHGPLFEAMIMDREQGNPRFNFLFDNTSPEHIYYRWKLFSLAQGDTKSKWMDEPFQMFRGGPWWIPPELPVLDEHAEDPVFDTDDEVTEQDSATKGTLGQIAKQRLAVLLKEVTFQRGTIARAMAFAIDHSEAATEVVDLLCKSITVADSPLSVKLARLYLVSDILHNSSVHVSNAWKYRKEFEHQLPVVFDHFNGIYRSISARLKAEQVRKHISAVIGVWEHWMIFPKYYTDQLTEIFLKKENGEAQSVASSSSPASDTATMEDLDGEAYEDDADGEPMNGDEDVDGEPIDDVDGEPMEEDVDGEPLGDDSHEQQLEHDIRDKQEAEALYTEVEDMFS
ncbi:U2-associated SR140 protein [Mucor lusitanicus]|uniref:U2-associated SR140 protein n=1 Tax=Mucor circinelloides f. lusitanicus TaxID=29924 RepID=A0A8H4EXG8_MUCCL|nr:U2-associated SR140 protein [Mucor lusitanicus]